MTLEQWKESTSRLKKCEAGHYLVMTNKDVVLGIASPKGELFKKRAVLTEVERNTEWTSECLRQIADLLDTLEETPNDKVRS